MNALKGELFIKLRKAVFRIPLCHFVMFCSVSLSAYALTSYSQIDRAVSIEQQIEQKTGLIVIPGEIKAVGAFDSDLFRRSLSWYDFVFLAKSDPKAHSDLYRLSAKTLDGKLLFAMRGLRNLSVSPDSNELNLSVDSQIAAVSTVTDELRQSFSIFNFGVPPKYEESLNSFELFREQITNFLETGKLEGISKTAVRFTELPQSSRLFIKDGNVTIEQTDLKGVSHNLIVQPNNKQSGSSAFEVTNVLRPVKPTIIWAVDTVRSLSFVGPGPIEWLEGRVFSIRDRFRRLRYAISDKTTEDIEDRSETVNTLSEFSLPLGLEIGKSPEKEIWPPPSFKPPVFSRSIPGEGIWKPASPELIKHFENAPPAFYKSVVRPDKERPYVIVQLFAMDMRQLELHMVGGIEDPRSTTGAAGDGRIPRRKDLMERTVAAFNGAFKTEHGAYGMMVERNVFLPPKDDAATVALLQDGTPIMGAWPQSEAVPPEMVSFRQNMDPLVEDGKVNPRRRYLWGFTLDTDISKMQTIRSGLCMSDKGYMVYVWGEDVTAQTLGIAMNAAGCTFGIHLDMNPHHTAFFYYNFELSAESAKPEYRYETPLPQTLYSPHRYVNGAPKDFFFLALKNKSPGSNWSAEDLAQTAPAFLPSIFRKDHPDCKMAAADLRRVSFEIRAGATSENTDSSNNPASDSLMQNDKDLLIDIDLGTIHLDDINSNEINETTSAVLQKDSLGKLVILPKSGKKSINANNIVYGVIPKEDNKIETASVCIGIRDNWLFIAEGALKNAFDHLKEEAVTETICFPSTKNDLSASTVFVRDPKGMKDLTNNRIRTLNLASSHLRLYAAPIEMGAKRLETIFSNSAEPNGANKKAENDVE